MKVLGLNKPVIAMIHVDALPGTPNYKGDVARIIKKAKTEAHVYLEAGVDILMLENMHDVPYMNRTAGPEITAMMSVLLHEVKNFAQLPLGVQILAGANKEALAAALAADADFIRAEGFVFSHIGDEGTFNSDAGEILRYRKQIGADNIAVFTDIKKKHSSHAVTADVSIEETAHAAEFFLSDGVIITGSATGKEPDVDELRQVSGHLSIPVLAGSGITLENLDTYMPVCDSVIVGSYFKEDGKWYNNLDAKKIENFMKKAATLR